MYTLVEVVEMLDNKEMQKIENKIEEVGKKLIQSGKRNRCNLMKNIKRRLYAYPQLKNNIERFTLDIKDLQEEKEFGKSKSIILYHGQGVRLDKEELTEQIRAEKIFDIERQMARDQAEINEIERGLKTIQDDPYYRALAMSFFEGKKQKEIAEAIPCVETTIWRNVGRLIDKLAVFWYGADALRD